MIIVLEEIPLALSFDDVLLVPQYSEIDSRSVVNLQTKISENLTLQIPLIATKMDTVTGVEMAIGMGKLGGLGILPRFDSIEIQADKVKEIAKAGVIVAAAVGVKPGFMERAEALVNAGATVIDVDVAHRHIKKTIETTKAVRDRFGTNITIFSGITSTMECADDLYSAGADSVLVGVGAGSICTTRIMTGFGVPSITSLMETAKAAKKHGKTFMPDAGVKNSGDIVKALATGASAVVSGNLFAGTDEAPGQLIEIGSTLYKSYNGSASEEEKQKQIRKDPSDKPSKYIVHVEGVAGAVPYKGPLSKVVEGYLAGLKSGFAYAGARNIEEFWSKAKFVRITNAGMRESNAHDIIVK